MNIIEDELREQELEDTREVCIEVPVKQYAEIICALQKIKDIEAVVHTSFTSYAEATAIIKILRNILYKKMKQSEQSEKELTNDEYGTEYAT